MFTLYRVDFCIVSKVSAQCEQETYASLDLACSPVHTFQKWWQGPLSLENVGWRTGYVGLHSDQIWTKL